jgi:hypothetical protein
MAKSRTKTHDVNEVANDPTDVFAEAAAAQAQQSAQASTPGTAEQTLQEALAATMPPAQAEHATAHTPHPNGNGHAAAQLVQDVANATAMPEEYKPKWIDCFAEYYPGTKESHAEAQRRYTSSLRLCVRLINFGSEFIKDGIQPIANGV